MTPTNRIDFLDSLRAFIILLVIAMHAAMAYITPPFPGWIHNPQTNSLFWLVGIVAESGVLMPILFFISGYFTLPSLLKREPSSFLKGKLIRLGIPYVIGITLLAPILVCMSYYSDGGTRPLGQMLAIFFTPEHNTQYHLWYLGVLLLFFGLVTVVRVTIPGLIPAKQSAARRPTALFFFSIIALTTTLSFVLNLFFNYSYGGNGWTRIIILQFQNVKAPLYIVYFLLGMVAYQNRWFTGGYRPRLFPWVAIYIIALLGITVCDVVYGGEPTTLSGKLLINLCASVEVMSALLTCLAFFQRLHNTDLPLLRQFSSLSFGAYIVHVNVLFVVLLLTKNTDMPLFPKYLSQVVLTVLVAWGISHLARPIAELAGSLFHRPLAREITGPLSGSAVHAPLIELDKRSR